MKKIVLFLSIFLIFFFPNLVSAHGGVEKSAGNILVTLFQTPLSPLVGEKVNFAFILTDPSKSHVLKNKNAEIIVTQTTTGEPSKDKIVYTKKVTSDVNGIINFTYIFPKITYYDIDIAFGKLNDESTTTGFLVQPREDFQNNIQFLEILVVISLILNFIFAFVWLRNFLRKIRS
jgi:hypothetical protein